MKGLIAMAEITVPIQEAVRALTASVALPPIVRRVEATAKGPLVVMRLSPLMGEFGVVIRFERFERGMALFSLDGMPNLINLNALLKPPSGIYFEGTRMAIRPQELLAGLGVKGLAVTGFAFENGVYRVTLAA